MHRLPRIGDFSGTVLILSTSPATSWCYIRAAATVAAAAAAAGLLLR